MVCTKCKQDKSEDKFSFKNKSLGKFQSHCKDCQNIAIRNHYKNNTKSYIDKATKQKAATRELIRNLKEASPCADCGNYFPYYVMDFDHREDKLFEVSRLVALGMLKKCLIEIKKCDLVCSNCHRVRTHNRASVV